MILFYGGPSRLMYNYFISFIYLVHTLYLENLIKVLIDYILLNISFFYYPDFESVLQIGGCEYVAPMLPVILHS